MGLALMVGAEGLASRVGFGGWRREQYTEIGRDGERETERECGSVDFISWSVHDSITRGFVTIRSECSLALHVFCQQFFFHCVWLSPALSGAFIRFQALSGALRRPQALSGALRRSLGAL